MLYPIELRAHFNTRNEVGRGRGIRTPDTLVPNQVRYQTALYPDFNLAYLKIFSASAAHSIYSSAARQPLFANILKIVGFRLFINQISNLNAYFGVLLRATL